MCICLVKVMIRVLGVGARYLSIYLWEVVLVHQRKGKASKEKANDTFYDQTQNFLLQIT
jgi:hypothetical protein